MPATNGVPKLNSKERRQKFLDLWPKIEVELDALLEHHNMPEEAREWFRKNLSYNTPGGKLNRGVSVVDTVEILKGRPLSEEEYFKAGILGWGVELLQAYFLVADDMMDASITRRGQPCWYRNEFVGNIAINDAFMLEAAIYHLLKVHFRSDPSYVYLLELFLETTLKTEIGQMIDLITAPEHEVDLSKFSLERHRLIVIYKTAYYSFYLPVALAMRYCGITSEDAYALALSILIPLGEYFQVQDDYLDCFGTQEQIGKRGTDIIDNKCSWVINTALNNATPEQRKGLDENYGRKDDAAEARVKAIFNEIGVEELYQAYEQKSYEKIISLINTIPESGEDHSPNSSAYNTPSHSRSSSPTKDGPTKGTGDDKAMLEVYPRTIEGHEAGKDISGLKREVFKSFLDKIYKRTK